MFTIFLILLKLSGSLRGEHAVLLSRDLRRGDVATDLSTDRRRTGEVAVPLSTDLARFGGGFDVVSLDASLPAADVIRLESSAGFSE